MYLIYRLLIKCKDITLTEASVNYLHLKTSRQNPKTLTLSGV